MKSRLRNQPGRRSALGRKEPRPPRGAKDRSERIQRSGPSTPTIGPGSPSCRPNHLPPNHNPRPTSAGQPAAKRSPGACPLAQTTSPGVDRGSTTSSCAQPDTRSHPRPSLNHAQWCPDGRHPRSHPWQPLTYRSCSIRFRSRSGPPLPAPPTSSPTAAAASSAQGHGAYAGSCWVLMCQQPSRRSAQLGRVLGASEHQGQGAPQAECHRFDPDHPLPLLPCTEAGLSAFDEDACSSTRAAGDDSRATQPRRPRPAARAEDDTY